MKKLFVLAAAAAAMTFASCGNKAGNTAAQDSTAVDSVEAVAQDANAAAEEAIGNIKTLLDGKDANALKSAIENVKAKAAEFLAQNPEVAKEYLTKVQAFLKENADKVKALVGDNAAVGAAVAALTETPADDVISGLSAALGDAKAAGADAAANAVDAASKAADAANKAAEAVKNAPEAAKQAADKAVEDAKAKANEKANEAVNNAKAKASEQIDKAAADAKKKLGL